MQYLSIALPLAAMVSGALATPARGNSCQNNACLAAVTGRAALGDGALRASHCSSYLATTVTPIVTVTETITGWGNNNNWKRTTVALCPNEVPNYASACDDAAYTSACSCFGFTEVKTTTIAPSTTTKTVYVKPTGGSGASCSASTVSITATVVSGSTCPAASTSTKYVGTGTTVTSTETKTATYTVVSGSTCRAATGTTVTETKTVPTWTSSSCPAGGSGTVTETKTVSGYSSCSAGSVVTVTAPGYSSCSAATATTVYVTVPNSSATPVTVTVTAPASSSSAPSSTCNVDDALATTLVNNFVNLLEHTSYSGNQAPKGSGYNQAVSDATLDVNFIDISDSINFMAGFPLGSITFNSKAAFDYGQGVLQPEVTVQVLNIWHDCNTITWRWRIVSLPFPVNGINHMEINSAGLIQKNYAEFDNGAWLQSFGRNCTTNTPVTVAPSPALKRSLLEM